MLTNSGVRWLLGVGVSAGVACAALCGACGGGSSGRYGSGGSGGTSGTGGSGTACRTDADCAGRVSYYCAAAGAAVGCGICPDPSVFPTCTDDSECNPDGGSQICIGACGGACLDKMCTAGCIDDTPCTEGTHCGATHRCEALSCTTNADCPANFDCSSSRCARRSCNADAQCQGYCVTGYCYTQLGQCLQPQG